MHPGWADTPGVRTAMPDFHKKLEVESSQMEFPQFRSHSNNKSVHLSGQMENG